MYLDLVVIFRVKALPTHRQGLNGLSTVYLCYIDQLREFTHPVLHQRHFLAFLSLFWAISISSTVEDDSVEAADCEECSNKSMSKGLFLNL